MRVQLNDRVLLEQAYRNVQEGVISNIGHATLDIAGLIPGVGEFADLTNAIWYCTQTPPNYLFAALSIISCIPTIGDIIGKGSKLGLLLGKASPKIVQAKKVIISNKNLIDKILKKCEENEKLRPYASQIRQALYAFMGVPGRLGPSTVSKPMAASGKIGPSTVSKPGNTSARI